LGRAAFRRRNSEKSFAKGPSAAASSWENRKSSCVAAAAAVRVCADVSRRCGERLYMQDTVRRFEEIHADWRGGGHRSFGLGGTAV
jgi:hypothetical protein